MNSEAIAHSRTIIANHSKSFSLATALLSRNLRDEAAVVYAWCRRADDAIDLSAPAEHAEAIRKLKAELDDIYAGKPMADPILAAFGHVVRAHSVPREYPQELLAGLEMDADRRRYETMDELLLYCFRVAGTVGLMMCHVLGVRRDEALIHATHLGIAMQLTNICRDVAEDWGRGRLYIPAALLRRHGASYLADGAGQLAFDQAGAALSRAVRDLKNEAEWYYASADRGLNFLSWRTALGVRTARFVYSSIGRRLAARDYDVFSGRAFVGPIHKTVLVAKAAAYALLEAPIRALTPFEPIPIRRVVRFPNDVTPNIGSFSVKDSPEHPKTIHSKA